MKKNIFTLNFVNKSIVGTKSAIARANKCLEPEYSELCALLEKHPTFNVEVKKIDQNKEKKTYNGLTFETMEEYISTQENSKEKLIEFKAIMKVAKAKGAMYPLTKKWFLKAYPEFKANLVDATEVAAEIAAMKKAAKELDKLSVDEEAEDKAA